MPLKSIAAALPLVIGLRAFAQPIPTGLTRPGPSLPPVVTPGVPSTEDQVGKAPSDAVVLFDGKDLSQWVSMNGSPTKWIMKDGYMECVKGSGYVRTLQNFGDCQLHVEWATPTPPHGEGQGRGNSGVFFGLDRYEVQVLDSFGSKTYADGSAGSIYGQYPPLANASLAPGNGRFTTSSIPRRVSTIPMNCAPRPSHGLPQRRSHQNNVELTGRPVGSNAPLPGSSEAALVSRTTATRSLPQYLDPRGKHGKKFTLPATFRELRRTLRTRTDQLSKFQPRNANLSRPWEMSASFSLPNHPKNSSPKPPTSKSNFRPILQENQPASFGPSAKAQIQPGR
jgi:hypothetical protein